MITITSNIDSFLQRLEGFEGRIDRKATAVCRTLCRDVGMPVADKGFATAQYDGNNDVTVVAKPIPNGGAVIATGKAVAFIEYGSGVHWNGSGRYPEPLPDGISPIGTYGHGWGRLDKWHYKGDAGTNGVYEMTGRWRGYIETYGNPPACAMYNAKRQMLDRAQEVANKEYGKNGN